MEGKTSASLGLIYFRCKMGEKQVDQTIPWIAFNSSLTTSRARTELHSTYLSDGPWRHGCPAPSLRTSSDSGSLLSKAADPITNPGLITSFSLKSLQWLSALFPEIRFLIPRAGFKYLKTMCMEPFLALPHFHALIQQSRGCGGQAANEAALARGPEWTSRRWLLG
jgi:hypothetical protein